MIILFFPLHVTAESFHTKKQIKNISNSVVKIFNVSASPNFYIPWQTLAQKHSTGTGVIIDHNLILTAAHVVNDTVFLEVKKESSVDKYIAKVKWISHETDLALLEVKDNTFFDNTEASHLGAVPSRQEGVVVYGYPTGGNEISLTQGIVSRIELTSYAHSEESFLALQIDAAINPGNSGGPVFNKEGEIVGIAMQKMTGVENIGYIVPPPIIEHFFEDIEDGTYDGYANDGLYVQPIQNDYLKSYYGLEDKKKCHTGILVINVATGSSTDGYLEQGDVIVAVDGYNIEDDGTVIIEAYGRINSGYLIDRHQVGQSVKYKILRDSKELIINVPLKGLQKMIPTIYDSKPEYLIYGGLIIMPLTKNYLKAWGDDWLHKAPLSFLYKYSYGLFDKNDNKQKRDNKEIVFVKQISNNTK